jgi:hypothetical protein
MGRESGAGGRRAEGCPWGRRIDAARKRYSKVARGLAPGGWCYNSTGVTPGGASGKRGAVQEATSQ